MYSVAQRLSALFALLVSLGLFLVICITSSSYFLNADPGSIQVDFYQLNIIKANDGYNRKYQRTTDAATLKLNILADFRPLFNWNVKEIFAYLVMEYESEDYVRWPFYFFPYLLIYTIVIETKRDCNMGQNHNTDRLPYDSRRQYQQQVPHCRYCR